MALTSRAVGFAETKSLYPWRPFTTAPTLTFLVCGFISYSFPCSGLFKHIRLPTICLLPDIWFLWAFALPVSSAWNAPKLTTQLSHFLQIFAQVFFLNEANYSFPSCLQPLLILLCFFFMFFLTAPVIFSCTILL